MNIMPDADPAADLVLIVGEFPDRLAPLQGALEEAGYEVHVTTSGQALLDGMSRALPDIVLLDVALSDIGALELARLLKADARTATTPIVLMTGPLDHDHVVGAFDLGVVDCVSKPVRASELIARIESHLRAARSQSQARSALDAFGHATLVVRGRDGRRLWQTALARELLQRHFPLTLPTTTPPPVMAWIARDALRRRAGAPPHGLTVAQGQERLTFAMHAMDEEGPSGDDWLVVIRQDSEAAQLQALARDFALTAREAEVLHWVIRGKTNRDIGTILALSPRTVHKHLEHVFKKLDVETRTAAAAKALGTIR